MTIDWVRATTQGKTIVLQFIDGHTRFQSRTQFDALLLREKGMSWYANLEHVWYVTCRAIAMFLWR